MKWIIKCHLGNIFNFVRYNDGMWFYKNMSVFFLETHTEVCRGEKTMSIIFFKILQQKTVEICVQ